MHFDVFQKSPQKFLMHCISHLEELYLDLFSFSSSLYCFFFYLCFILSICILQFLNLDFLRENVTLLTTLTTLTTLP